MLWRASAYGYLHPTLHWLMLSLAATFVIQLVVGPTWVANFAALSGDAIAGLQFHRLVSYGWFFDSPIELVFNLFFLWLLGQPLAVELGSRRFVQLFATCLLVGSVVFALFNWGLPVAVLGASAVISGLFIALATLHPRDSLHMFFVEVQVRWIALVYVFLVTTNLLWIRSFQGESLCLLGSMVAGFAFIKWTEESLEPMFDVSLPSTPDFQVSRPRRNGGGKASKRSEENPREFISSEVDPILEKISREGFQSLTEREKKILEDARKRL